MEERGKRAGGYWNQLVEREEALVWLGFYRRSRRPAFARTLVKQLDQEPELKSLHAALYLRCVQTVAGDDERRDRAQHAGGLLRRSLSFVLLAPWRWLGGGIGYLSMVMAAGVAPYEEPAKAQLRTARNPKPRNTAARYKAASGGRAQAAVGDQ